MQEGREETGESRGRKRRAREEERVRWDKDKTKKKMQRGGSREAFAVGVREKSSRHRSWQLGRFNCNGYSWCVFKSGEVLVVMFSSGVSCLRASIVVCSRGMS